MVAYLLRFSIVLFILFPLAVYSDEENPSACDCKAIVISAQEEQDGCPASVKREACTTFREMEQWQIRLRQQRELRRLEEKMPPPRR
jgi:hypothetical protein